MRAMHCLRDLVILTCSAVPDEHLSEPTANTNGFWVAVWHVVRGQLGAPLKGAIRRHIALQGTLLFPPLAQ
jgi:hypothetical protein